MVGQIRRFGRYRPVFCSRIKGSIQRDLSLSLSGASFSLRASQ